MWIGTFYIVDEHDRNNKYLMINLRVFFLKYKRAINKYQFFV